MIELIKISELKLFKDNPRTISKDALNKLCASIEEDPDFLRRRPVLVNFTIEGGYEVYAGNMRVRAAKRLKWKEIPCLVDHNLSDKLKRSRVIKDNLNAGDFDYDLLASNYDIEELVGYGFDIEQLIGKQEKNPAKDVEAIDKPANPKTKYGDLYELNGHRILCGDSTQEIDVNRVLGGVNPILMVTDPPYGVNYDANWRIFYEKHRKIHRDNCSYKCGIGKVQNDNQIDWSKAFKLFKGDIAYICCASLFLPEVGFCIDKIGFERKSLIIWVKQNFILSRGDYHWQHENCWYAVRKGKKHNWQGSRKESTVWEIQNRSALGDTSKIEEGTGHSTQKPLECMMRPIRNNTARGESVYDPFIGSGTTLIAAEQLGRTCFGIDIDPAYIDVTVDRWVRYMKENNLEYNVKKLGQA